MINCYKCSVKCAYFSWSLGPVIIYGRGRWKNRVCINKLLEGGGLLNFFKEIGGSKCAVSINLLKPGFQFH